MKTTADLRPITRTTHVTVNPSAKYVINLLRRAENQGSKVTVITRKQHTLFEVK